mgnify:CR=1 FL=1
MTTIFCDLYISTDSLSDFEAEDLDIDAILRWTYVEDPKKRQQRIELANKLPILVPMLVFDPDNIWSQDIAAQLDRGASLQECLTEVFPIENPKSAQALIGKPLALLGEWSGDVLGLMLAIACVEVEALPATDAEWKIFSAFAQALHPCNSMLSGIVFRSLCSPSLTSSYEAILETVNGDPNRLSLINDYSSYLGRWYAVLFQSNGARKTSANDKANSRLAVSDDDQEKGEALAKSRLKNFSVIQLLSQATRWESAVRQAATDAYAHATDPELKHWPALFEEPVVGGGFRVLSLTSASEVVTEYRKLDLDFNSALLEHAVWNTHFVVLRDMSGATRTVASLWIKGPEAGWYLLYDSDHRGHGGRYPYQEEVDALDNALKLFWEDKFQERLVALAQPREIVASDVVQKLEAPLYRRDVMEAVLTSLLPSSLVWI